MLVPKHSELKEQAPSGSSADQLTSKLRGEFHLLAEITTIFENIIVFSLLILVIDSYVDTVIHSLYFVNALNRAIVE